MRLPNGINNEIGVARDVENAKKTALPCLPLPNILYYTAKCVPQTILKGNCTIQMGKYSPMWVCQLSFSWKITTSTGRVITIAMIHWRTLTWTTEARLRRLRLGQLQGWRPTTINRNATHRKLKPNLAW